MHGVKFDRQPRESEQHQPATTRNSRRRARSAPLLTMAPQPTVGLVGSRVIDGGLQSTDKKTVTKYAFPSASRTPEQISIPREGAVGYKGPKLGDCYMEPVEDTNLYARAAATNRPAGARGPITLAQSPQARGGRRTFVFFCILKIRIRLPYPAATASSESTLALEQTLTYISPCYM